MIRRTCAAHAPPLSTLDRWNYEELLVRYRCLFALMAGCGWFAQPRLAHADALAAAPLNVPAANTPTIAQKLGVNEGLLSFCSAIDPAGSEKLRQEIRQLLQGANERRLVELRGTDEYRRGRASVAAFAGKLEKRNAKRMCAESPAGRK